MRNLIIIISVLFVTIIAVSYFYFSNLSENNRTQPDENELEEAYTEQDEPTVGSNVLWTFDLNGGAITNPSVQQYGDSTRFILVQDAYHILHAISPDGKKLWNAQLPGPIIDSISQLSDHSLVFTTADRLYRIDTDGDPLPGFSLTLPQQATHGALAINDGDGMVRIEVTGRRQVLLYDGRGKLLRRQARNNSAGSSGMEDEVTSTLLSNIPDDCGPLVYIGPLNDDSQRYVLCGKNDRKLHCLLY